MKSTLVAAVLCVLLCGCIMNPDYLLKDYVINNKSSLEVAFSLKNYDSTPYILSSGSSLSKRMYSAPKLLFDGNPRVIYASGMDNCRIIDMPAWKIEIINSNPKVAIKVSEKNNMLGEWGKSIEIPPTIETTPPVISKVTAKLYTRQPEFLVFYVDADNTPALFSGVWEDDVYKLSVR